MLAEDPPDVVRDCDVERECRRPVPEGRPDFIASYFTIHMMRSLSGIGEIVDLKSITLLETDEIGEVLAVAHAIAKRHGATEEQDGRGVRERRSGGYPKTIVIEGIE